MSGRFKIGLTICTAVLSLTLAAPSHALPTFGVGTYAYGSGTDGVGNRLTVASSDNAILGGGGIAFVRLATQPGPSIPVLLTCAVITDTPGFDFLYSNGIGADGQQYYIGVLDDNGPGRHGPYDVMYTQTSPGVGPCGVNAGSKYPQGWFPVSSGDFIVGPR